MDAVLPVNRTGERRGWRRRLLGNPEGFPVALVMPALVLEAVFVFLPLAIGIYYSLHDVRFFQVRRFVGLENYWSALNSSLVINSIMVTSVFTVFSLVFTFVIGIALALHLERDSRSNVAIRVVVLIPYVISMLVGSLLLKWLMSQDAGVLQMILGPFGLGDFSVFADSRNAMAALVYNGVWRDSAFAMILLLAGLKSIPPSLHAAALIDGASPWYRFRRITLPLLRIPILITLVRLLMHFANALTFPLVLTGGGPVNSTETIGLRIFRLGFEEYLLGKANAMAFLVVLFNMSLVVVLIRLFRDPRSS